VRFGEARAELDKPAVGLLGCPPIPVDPLKHSKDELHLRCRRIQLQRFRQRGPRARHDLVGRPEAESLPGQVDTNQLRVRLSKAWVTIDRTLEVLIGLF
jgi:hypothetical protein